MGKFPVIIDVETKKTFREQPEPSKLGISVAVCYNYADKTLTSYFEDELPKLFHVLERASCIIGYNSKSFDIPVLSGYYNGNTEVFAQFDILEDIREKIGRRLALNDVILATLNKKKTGHGLQAIEFYKKGMFTELAQYCSDDVDLTRQVFDWGVKYGEIYYNTEKGKQIIKVNWKKYLQDDVGNDTPLTLGF
jgi:hypothetical protein